MSDRFQAPLHLFGQDIYTPCIYFGIVKKLKFASHATVNEIIILILI
jgi:hypothetical protein